MVLLQDPSFWVLIAFIIFVGLVWFKARGIIVSLLDVRVERIKAELDEAQKLKEQAQETLAEQRQLTRQAVEKAEAILEDAKKEAAEQLKLAEKKLEATIAQRHQQAMIRLEQAEATAVAEVAEKTVALTTQISRAILQEQMAGSVGSDTIDQAIKQVDKLAKEA